MLPKTQQISYPGELPDISHSTISLRTQLRLSYETYSWLRYLTWTGSLLLGVLLFFLPGGFPPAAFVQLWQTAPQIGHLVALHGGVALLSLGALLAQTLTWFLLWVFLLGICLSLARYTLRLAHSRTVMANAWQPSAVLGDSRDTHAEERDMVAKQTTPFAAVSQTQSPGATAAPLQARQLHSDPLAQSATTPNGPLIRPPFSSLGGDTFAGTSAAGWPSLNASGSTGVAWDTGITRRGRPNEDSVLTLRGTCNFADRLLPFELHMVADGMGGHAHGRLASHLAIRSMLETVVPGLVACNAIVGEQIIDVLVDGVHWANQVIFQYGKEQGSEMGTTLTAVLLLDETAYIINVGDSRTYICRSGSGLAQITRDHSLVARLVETGAIAPDDVYTHPERNKVYRGLGDKTDVTVDWFILPVQIGDLFLLCSDGLWEMVRNPKIAEIMQMYASAPSLASHALLRAAL
ncbi:MAG TPA: protein phosphatase 2C domain-containing protein, partial [Ktedonobacteraceae bacterium]|nr:protein phosphatase 2C domain-containing protein [Ktedonobacteraceae bacterium]